MKQLTHPSIELYLFDPDETVPDEWKEDGQIRYFIQGSDLFCIRHNDLCSFISVVKDEVAEKIINECFADQVYKTKEAVLVKTNWNNYRLSIDDFRYVMKYFQEIYDTHGTEAAVLLMLNSKTAEWRVLPVLQYGRSGASVDYVYPSVHPDNLAEESSGQLSKIAKDPDLLAQYKAVYQNYSRLRKEGFKVAGTIHSHCNFSAFHSSTDDADEIGFDGLHITIGNVNSGWSFSARYMVGGYASQTTVEEIFGMTKDEICDQSALDDIAIKNEDLDLLVKIPVVTSVFSSTYNVPNTWNKATKSSKWKQKNGSWWYEPAGQYNPDAYNDYNWDNEEGASPDDGPPFWFDYLSNMVFLLDPDGEIIVTTEDDYSANLEEFAALGAVIDARKHENEAMVFFKTPLTSDSRTVGIENYRVVRRSEVERN
jgi:hypothetical protein